jgi:hypothetical protein
LLSLKSTNAFPLILANRMSYSKISMQTSRRNQSGRTSNTSLRVLGLPTTISPENLEMKPLPTELLISFLSVIFTAKTMTCQRSLPKVLLQLDFLTRSLTPQRSFLNFGDSITPRDQLATLSYQFMRLFENTLKFNHQIICLQNKKTIYD